MTNTEGLAKIVINALEDKKANDIKVIDIRELSVIADYFIIGKGKPEKAEAFSDRFMFGRFYSALMPRE